MIRALRDRLLGWPIWGLLLGGFVISRVVVGLIVQGTAMWVQPESGVGHEDPTYLDLAVSWDGQWYQRIATRGYPLPLPLDPVSGRPTQSAWAFYPAFPMAVRAVMATGLPFLGAALVVNLAASFGAVLVLWRVLAATAGEDRLYERMAVLTTLVWLIYPATAVLQIAYSEALGMLLLCLVLLTLIRRQYAWCSVAVLALGFCRGIAPPIGIVVLVHAVTRWREDRDHGIAPLRAQRLSMLGLLASTGVAAVAWPAFVGWRTGRLDAFFAVQANWGQRPDRGLFVAWLDWAWYVQGAVGVLLLVGTLVLYCLLVVGVHGRWLAPEVRTWAVAYPLFLFALSGPSTSMWRFLMLNFPLLAVVVSVVVRGAGAGHVLPSWPRRLLLVGAALLAGVIWWTTNLLVYAPLWDWPP
ncbi:MAG TPA: hypothetical protein VES01_08025 [Dermatophilaceae bacterium]|nr:hypothetical protein [Dermatophilaceae bacterium]